MLQIQEQVIKENGYTLHLIPNEKFKTINIVAKMKAPLERETITKRALLPYVLQQGTRRYPTRLQLQSALDDLYGAVLSLDGAKKGDFHIISYRLEVANQKFIQQETDIVEKAINLLYEVIFQPNMKGIGFEPTVFAREKETLKEKIAAITDDKLAYANMRLMDEMCVDEAYGLHVHGYKEDLVQLTPENTYHYYEQLLMEDDMDIYIMGDFDSNKMQEFFRASFVRTDSGNNEYEKLENTNTSQNRDLNREPQEVIEKQPIQQAKLHIGYRTNCTYRDETYAALQVFNGIFGGFPSSKLFINVREKNSLAYYAASRIESHKGLLIVFSGITSKDYKKARAIMEQQMTAMKEGKFTEEDMEEAKEQIMNQLLETMDHPQGMMELLYQQVIANRSLSPHELIAQIKATTIEQVIHVASNIQEDTIYLLTGEEDVTNA
ncbi:pitrilysin family protein [Virgibacillus sp. LDC-1]|uniref:EF-P 5-aminopentanol modification-associated protein YfmF n=1 Tax=Virgibacillus sp. LDC-1 TaxID=3039856 RepID=UPI0024DE45D6|nr:pitrilysin family protein [Virgibacillus sp. LDC-1]